MEPCRAFDARHHRATLPYAKLTNRRTPGKTLIGCSFDRKCASRTDIRNDTGNLGNRAGCYLYLQVRHRLLPIGCITPNGVLS